MSTYLNSTGIPLSVALYLATDHYDYIPDAISATALMRPIRQQVLTPRVPKGLASTELIGLLKSRMGTSIHDGIEKAWLNPETRKVALHKLGYPDNIAERIVINPPGGEPLPKKAIAVHMEQRMFRSFQGKTLSGKYDFAAEGRLEDFKSTGTFTWVNDTKTEDHQLQGSIYNWLDKGQKHPILTSDHMAIQYIFTDWMAGRASDPKYPSHPTMQKLIPLLSLDDTEAYVQGKLAQFDQYKNTAEPELPLCNDKELWRKAPEFKYYRDPKKRTRSTKNFDNPAEAHARLMKDGGKGIVIEKPGDVVACKYCPAFAVCTQKDSLIADGSLVL